MSAETASEVQVKFGVFYEHQVPRPWDDDYAERVAAGEDVSRRLA